MVAGSVAKYLFSDEKEMLLKLYKCTVFFVYIFGKI